MNADADVKDVYPVLARLNHTYDVADVEVTGFYLSSLNYYRVLSKRETFPKFELKVQRRAFGRQTNLRPKWNVIWRGVH